MWVHKIQSSLNSSGLTITVNNPFFRILRKKNLLFSFESQRFFSDIFSYFQHTAIWDAQTKLKERVNTIFSSCRWKDLEPIIHHHWSFSEFQHLKGIPAIILFVFLWCDMRYATVNS